jgi:hypothetical protein
MSNFDFNCYSTGSLIVSFRCDSCNAQVHSEPIDVAEPHYGGDNARDSSVESEGDAFCPKCDKQFEVRLMSSLGGGWGEVVGLHDSMEVEIEEQLAIRDRDEYFASIAESSRLSVLEKTLWFVEKLTSENRSPEDEFSLCVMLHLHCIAALERYLASHFIHLVIGDQVNLRKFVEHDPVMKDMKIQLSDIFNTHDDIRTIVAKRLDSILFHQIDTVQAMYRATAGVSFGDVRWLKSAVFIRHDCAHRAGHDKNGIKVSVNYASIIKLKNKCLELARNVDSQSP